MSRKMYLHLIDGRAAYFSQHDEQIVLMENSAIWKDVIRRQSLRPSRNEIHRDQQITLRNRKKWGMESGAYGYAIVTIPAVKPERAAKPQRQKATK